MSTQESGRHYYEHPNHSARERAALEVTDLYLSRVHGVDPNVNIPVRQVEPMRHEAMTMPQDVSNEFYRNKLREGFVDLRNSYNQRLANANSQQKLPVHLSSHQIHPQQQMQLHSAPVYGNKYPGHPTQVVPPNTAQGHHLQPRNRGNESSDINRPLSMHATAPGHSIYDSSQNNDYNTISSRGSADSYHGVSSHHPAANGPLFRSSSDLHLETSQYANDAALRRDFGSADFLEMRQMGDPEFFALLQTYKSDNPDQRAPPPPGMQTALRGEPTLPSGTLASFHHSASEPMGRPASQTYNIPQNTNIYASHSHQGSFASASQVASSPPSHQAVEFIKRSPKAQKKARPRSGDVSVLFRKLKSNKGDYSANRNSEASSDAQITELLSILPEERLRKKAFVHYDCQSVAVNFVLAADKRRNCVQQGNMKTGASAASQLDELGNREDFYHNRPSPLVAPCSAFVTELGGEEERNVTLCKETAFRKAHTTVGHSQRFYTQVYKHPICNGISILDGLPGADNRQSLLEKHRGVYVLEYKDKGCSYYRQYFRHEEHHNYFGVDDNLGPVAVSIKREKIIPNTRLFDPSVKLGADGKSHSDLISPAYQYRVIVRTGELNVLRGVIVEDALPAASKMANSSRGLPAKDIIEYVVPEISLSCLKQATNDEKTKDEILNLDQQGKVDSYKVGIMYCRAGQSTEEEMYNNEHGSPAFVEFLDLIGKKVKLSGFDKFKGGLDNKTDTTGTHSYYTTCQSSEIMFHVSTLLPFENNRQQLLRKRHIGNDIVTVVFQEPGSLPFDVTSVRSQFQHVFIIVRVVAPNTDHTSYSVAVTRSKDVPAFGPPITQVEYQHGPDFADFLIAKILNAENAAQKSDKFQAMAVRTRGQYLQDLAANHVTSTSLENSSKLGKFSIMGGGKKKEKKGLKVVPDICSRGGISWLTQLEDFGQGTIIDIYLVISADVVAVLERESGDVIFTCWCLSVLGWTNVKKSEKMSSPGLKIYFNEGECIFVKPIDQDDCIEIMERLRIVTPGCETDDIVLRRNENGQLGFHVHMGGLISDIEPHTFAWEAGLRHGSRLVEICKVASATLTHDGMIDLLRNTATVQVSVIPPLEEGRPRRSLEDKPQRSSDYYMLYPTEDTKPRNNIDGEESSAYYSDDEHSPHTVMSVAKRVNTVTLRSSSSGGSSCSPGSTLSGKQKHSSDRRNNSNPHHPDIDRAVSDSRALAHSRSRSNDHACSDTESVSRRPAPGPVYTPNQAQNHYAPAGYYGSSLHQSSEQLKPPVPTGARRAAKDWKILNGPKPYSKNNNYESAYPERVGRPDHYHSSSGSQELLERSGSRTSGNSDTQLTGIYSNVEGYNGGLHRTFSDESLHSLNRRQHLTPGHPYVQRRASQDVAFVKPTTRPPLAHAASQPAGKVAATNPSGEEDLDWSRLVSTAAKALESSPQISYATYIPWNPAGPTRNSLSHDSSTDRENSSLPSGHSTPTQDKNKDLDARYSSLERELQAERRRSKDLERRLQLEKNRNEDLQKENMQLKKENSSLRHEVIHLKEKVNKFTQNFVKAVDGPESVT